MVFTSPSRGPGCRSGKIHWSQHVLGIDEDRIRFSSNKSDYARPGDILIDDNEKNIEEWENEGGIGVLWPQRWNSAGHISHGAVLEQVAHCKDLPEKKDAPPLVGLIGLHIKMCERAREIMEAKNHDYTCGSADPFANFRLTEAMGISPVKGVLIRLMDKIQRIRSFDELGKLAVDGEGVDDACLDILNYVVIIQGMLNERNRVDNKEK